MRLLWAFMGASAAYSAFAGLAELCGALLLLFRRTTTLGALILAASLTNVTMLNFAYEVGVKLPVTVYFLAALTLLAPEVGKLSRVFLFNDQFRPASRDEQRDRWRQRIVHAIKAVIVLWMVGSSFQRAYAGYKVGSDGAPLPSLYGVYTVEKVDRLRPAENDEAPVPVWRRFVVSERGVAAIQPVEGPVRRYEATIDTVQHLLSLTPSTRSNESLSFGYVKGAEGSLVFSGMMDGDSVRIYLRNLHLQDIPLRRPVR
jgi:hypothetical protein